MFVVVARGPVLLLEALRVSALVLRKGLGEALLTDLSLAEELESLLLASVLAVAQSGRFSGVRNNGFGDVVFPREITEFLLCGANVSRVTIAMTGRTPLVAKHTKFLDDARVAYHDPGL